MSHDFKNLMLAVLLSVMVLGAWQYFYDSPRRDGVIEAQNTADQTKVIQKEEMLKKSQSINTQTSEVAVGKIELNTNKLQGSISLKGLRFDNLQLKSYKETLAKNSQLVRLFSDQGEQAYFAEFGWLSSAEDQTVPDKNSIWQCDKADLTSMQPISCYWDNNNGVNYLIKISIDEDYLFTIQQTAENKGTETVSIANYGRIYKAHDEPKQFAILHEGAVGAFGDVLKESTYEDLSKKRQEIFTNTVGSWAGITNKYWLSALVPDYDLSSKTNFVASSVSNTVNPHDVYNVNYISQDINLSPGTMTKSVSYLFAGAKEDKLLSKYEKDKGFVLFDRSIDFGIFYFITKPLFLLISYLYSILGNFGLAILAVTLMIKLLMYPLANKSFQSMARMKELQPRIEQIKKRCSDDKMKLNQEMMELYKKEKINPAAGCLPLLIQIPVFFSLYKVIFISIEMRHAPFYGWIHDLSADDPTSIWNLFGFFPWGSFSMLDIGVWPLIMGITMYIQQRLGPEPTDPIQANVMKFMPLVLVVMLYSLPSGLMIYWSFSNILSIAQQYAINKTTELKARKVRG